MRYALPILALLLATPAMAQNLPGQGNAPPQTTNLRNYTLKNQSGQVITKAQATFSNGDSKSVAPASGIQTLQGQSFGEDQRACLTHIAVTLKDGTALSLDAPSSDCKLAIVLVQPKAIVVNSSASLKPAMSN